MRELKEKPTFKKTKPEKERVPGPLLGLEGFSFQRFFGLPCFFFSFFKNKKSQYNSYFFKTMLFGGIQFARDRVGCSVSDPCECFARVKSQKRRWSMPRGGDLLRIAFSKMLVPDMLEF